MHYDVALHFPALATLDQTLFCVLQTHPLPEPAFHCNGRQVTVLYSDQLVTVQYRQHMESTSPKHPSVSIYMAVCADPS